MSETFSFEKIKDFEAHIRASIPFYQELRYHIAALSAYFVRDNYPIIDIGCSTGDQLFELEELYRDRPIYYFGYDISDNLLPKAPYRDKMTFENRDVTACGISGLKPSLVLSIFTFQFIERTKREKLLRMIYDLLPPGGALIIAEKVYSADGLLQDIMTFSHYGYKLKAFSSEDIIKKQYDLRLIMRPLTVEENEAQFREAGFTRVQSFWRSLNFVAWVLVK